MITVGCDRCGTKADMTWGRNKRPEGWSTLRLDTTGSNLKGRDAIITDLLCPDCGKAVRTLLDNHRKA